MKKSLLFSLRTSLLLFVFVIDGQISFFLTALFKGQVFITSYLFLGLLILYVAIENRLTLLFWAVLLGLIHDNYYLNSLGVLIFLLPLLIFLIVKFKVYLFRHRFGIYCLFLLSLTFLMLGLYGVSRLYGWTSQDSLFFLTAHYLPSLAWNAFSYIWLLFLVKAHD